MKRTFTGILTLLLPVVLASLLCISMYHYNNKYTKNLIQPSHGQLVVSDEYLKDFQYLIDGWEFYPDVLFTPEEYADLASDTYMVYTGIGDKTRFDGLGVRNTPHGCGTYALHLWLPEETHSYALELPEIYSAYRLYINGEEALQVGTPEEEHYTPRTQTKLLTFDASGRIDILIAVSDHSHFYSGMVYPPTFGLSEKVVNLQNIRLGIISITSTIGILLALFSIYFGFRMKDRNTILFALLCIVMCGIISFPLLHTYMELSIQPWYALELICINFMMLLVLVLHNRICDMPDLPRCISVGIAGIFCILAGCYGFCAPILTVSIMRQYSNISYLFKLGTAAYLLITAGFAQYHQGFRIQKNETRGSIIPNDDALPIYCASIAYAAIFLWDRILPDYEPIIYGWFSDYGNLILIIAIGYTLWRDMVTAHTYHLAFAEEHRQMTRQLSMQNAYLDQLYAQNEENRRLTHDFRHHLRTISGLTEQIQSLPETSASQEQLIDYLKQVTDNTFSSVRYKHGTFSFNPAVDALLQYYHTVALEHQIHIDIQLLLPSGLRLSDVEICTVIGNLLENAIDACNRLTEDTKRKIVIKSQETESTWFLLFENTYDGVVKQKQNRFVSRKGNGTRMGIGVESVREIIHQYDGTMEIYPQEKIFKVGITLPFEKLSRF